MVNIEKSNMDYDTDAAKSLNVSYSDIQNNISSMGCNEKFQEFEEKFNTLDTKYNNILEQGKVYDKMANETNNVKNNNLISNKYNSNSTGSILRNEFANIKECEDKVLSNIEEMIIINNENNLETENTDNSIWSMIDNFITNLIGGIVPSAKADMALNLCGDLCPLNDGIFKTVWGNDSIIDGVFNNYIDDELFSYKLSNGELTLPNGRKILVPAFITEGYVNMPPKNQLINPEDSTSYLNAIDRLNISMLLAGYEDDSVLDSSFNISDYGSYKETIILSPSKKADTVYNQEDLMLIAKFFTVSLRTNTSDEAGKLDCYAHSNSAGTLGKVLSKDDNDYFNGKVVFYDYAPIRSGDGRGQKVDQYTEKDIENIKSHQRRNKQPIVIYDAGGGNSSYINAFNGDIGDNGLCVVIPYNATSAKKIVGHGKIYFQDLLKNELGLYK